MCDNTVRGNTNILDTFNNYAWTGYESRDLALAPGPGTVLCSAKAEGDKYVMLLHVKFVWCFILLTKELVFFQCADYGLSFCEGWVWSNTSFSIQLSALINYLNWGLK